MSQVGSSLGVAEALTLVKKLEEQLRQLPAPPAPAAAAGLALPPIPDVSEDEDDDRSAEASLVAPPAMRAAEEGDDYDEADEAEIAMEWYKWKVERGQDWDNEGWGWDEPDEENEGDVPMRPQLTCKDTACPKPVATPVRSVKFAPGSPAELVPKPEEDVENSPPPPPCLRRMNADMHLIPPSEVSTKPETPEPASGMDGSEVASAGERVNSTTHKKEYMRLVHYSANVLIQHQVLLCCMFCHVQNHCPSKKRLIDSGALADYPNMQGLATGTCKDHMLQRFIAII